MRLYVCMHVHVGMLISMYIGMRIYRDTSMHIIDIGDDPYFLCT